MTLSRRGQYSFKVGRERAKREKRIPMGIPAFPTLEAVGVIHLLGQRVAERPWQCLQTGDGRETIGNRKGKEVGEVECGETENWRGRFPRACVGPNASNLADLEADEVIAWKYDVMRLCMRSHLLLGLLSRLHLSGPFGESERIWCRCRPNGLGFSANIWNRSSTVR